MVLGKRPVPGRPTSLDNSTRAYNTCGWGWLDIFSLVYHFSLLSPSPWKAARYRLIYCLKGPLNPKQSTNQLIHLAIRIDTRYTDDLQRKGGAIMAPYLSIIDTIVIIADKLYL